MIISFQKSFVSSLLIIASLSVGSAQAQKMANGEWQGFMVSPGMADLQLTMVVEKGGEAATINWIAGSFPVRDVEVGPDWYKFTWSPAFEVICLVKKKDNGYWAGACKDESGGRGPMIIGPPNKDRPKPADFDFQDAAMIWEQMTPKKAEEFIPKIAKSNQVTLNGTTYNFVSTGEGDVTVIFESGEADELRVWSEVYSKVAVFAKVFMYDRAGHGQSGMGRGSRDSETIANELSQLLEAAGQSGPYIVVGHSAGALHARKFAGLNPAQVEALVLIDPTHELEKMELSKLDAASWSKYASGQKMLANIASGNVEAEHDELAAVLDNGKFDDGIENASIKATILSHFSGKKEPRWVGESKEGQLAIQALHKDLSARFADGKLVVHSGGSGYIHRENPDMVVNAIRSLIDGR